MRRFSTCQQAQLFARLSKPRNQFCFLEISQGSEGRDAPHGEGFRMFRGKIKNRKW